VKSPDKRGNVFLKPATEEFFSPGRNLFDGVCITLVWPSTEKRKLFFGMKNI
jgi:hypothetical protein